MSMMTPERFIGGMKRTPILMQTILKDVTPALAHEARDGDDGWNILEVMCHLRDFEQIFFDRARQMVEQDHPTLIYVDHEALAIEKRYAAEEFQTVVDTWLQKRHEFISWLKARAETDWQRTGSHPQFGEITVIEQAMQVVTHDVNHIEQIIHTLAAFAEATA